MPQEHNQVEGLPEMLRPHNREKVQRFNPDTKEYEWVTVVHDWHEETPAAAAADPPVIRGEDLSPD